MYGYCPVKDLIVCVVAIGGDRILLNIYPQVLRIRKRGDVAVGVTNRGRSRTGSGKGYGSGAVGYIHLGALHGFEGFGESYDGCAVAGVMFGAYKFGLYCVVNRYRPTTHDVNFITACVLNHILYDGHGHGCSVGKVVDVLLSQRTAHDIARYRWSCSV